MLVRGSRRSVLYTGPLAILLCILLYYFHEDLIDLSPAPSSGGKTGTKSSSKDEELVSIHNIDGDLTGKPPKQYTTVPDREIYSVSTLDRKYFSIDFGGHVTLNPNIIPHPVLNDTWFIVAQKAQDPDHPSVWNVELVCLAKFKDGALSCLEPAMNLPIAGTPGDKCHGKGIDGALGLSIGPHDARVFYGPKDPYTMYGSNSEITCFGMWMSDFRPLVDWGVFEQMRLVPFSAAKELQRPGKYYYLEKNWFVFWDMDDQMFLHHDLSPKRVFAKLSNDGTVGKDLASVTAKKDSKCMAEYMPKHEKQLESVHQATNSLSITMCNRLDPACEVTDANTFVITIFQHKTYYYYHGDYRPYVMAFQRKAPFALHGISRKPLWIHGRQRAQLGNNDRVAVIEGEPRTRPLNQNEMIYITSMSWRQKGLKYHGYMDDIIFLAFGIEDRKTGGLDVLAGELVADLGLCDEL